MTLKTSLKKAVVALSVAFFAIVGVVSAAAAPYRPTASVTIAKIPVDRIHNVTAQFGGYNNTTALPNMGQIVQNSVGVYPDSIGVAAYVILFSIPIIMAWFVSGDIAVTAILGIFIFSYAFLYIPSAYQVVCIGGIAVSIAALIYSLYKRSY